MFGAKCHLEVEPGLVAVDLGELVVLAAIGFDRDAEGFGFVPDQFELLWGMNAVAGFGVGVEEEGGFAFVHVAEGELLSADGLHDADDDGGTRAELVDGVFRFWIGEIVVVS